MEAVNQRCSSFRYRDNYKELQRQRVYLQPFIMLAYLCKTLKEYGLNTMICCV